MMAKRVGTFCMALALLSACNEAEVRSHSQVEPDPPPDPTDLELSQMMFRPDHVLQINVTMAPADWDVLRLQARSIFDILGSSCLSAPESPFTYFPATVIIDDAVVENVGVRKKGFFGSLDNTKPSLKIDLNQYVPGQKLSGMKQFTFNNDKSDPSHIKQCLGYWLLDRAGIPAPRCSFAKVMVNDVDLGVFTHVEGIRKLFISRFFSDTSGNLYEGALSDFRPGWVDTFQDKNDFQDRADLAAMVAAAENPDATLLSSLQSLTDVDDFITFWVMERLIAHADGYARNTNNFYLYHDPTTGLLTFIPWGIDATFFSADAPLPWEDSAPPAVVWSEGILARRLFNLPETQARYYARAHELLNNVWIESEINSEIDRMQSLLQPYIESTKQTEFSNEVQKVRDYVNNLRAGAEVVLAETPPVLGSTLRDPWCVDVLGTWDGSFDTTWGTIGTADPFGSGTGTFALTLGGNPVATTTVGSVSGVDTNSGSAVIQVLASDGGSVITIAHIVISDGNMAPRSIPLDWVGAAAYLVRVAFVPGVPEPTFEVVGMLGEGLLELSAGGTILGDSVQGSIVGASVFESIF